MSNEYLQHLQCQTCNVHFPTNHELVGHIEEYKFRERLLLAELERCRIHIARLDDPRNGNDGVDSDGNDEHGCPYRGCGRKSPFTTRSNLFRHFQTHVQCYEICPFCHEIITQVYRFANHDCKAPRDKAKNTYLQRRVKHLNEVVTRELNRLNKLRDKTRKRKRGDPDSDSVPPQKLVKMKHHVEGSGEASREMACPLDPMKIAAANNSEWPSDSAELITEVISGGALDNGPPAFAGAGVVVNSEWVLTETAATVPSDSALGNEAPAVNNRGWEFAETDAIVYADNAGIPPDVLSDPGLAEAVISSNDGGWAFAEMTTFPPADDSGWAFTNTVGAMCTNDAGWAFERDP